MLTCVTAKAAGEDIEIENYQIIPHHGSPKKIIEDIFNSGYPKKVAVTGRKFRNLLNASAISEAEAIEYSIECLKT